MKIPLPNILREIWGGKEIIRCHLKVLYVAKFDDSRNLGDVVENIHLDICL